MASGGATTIRGRQRLLGTAEFLEDYVKDDWFDLGYWATDGFTEKKCGTTACAFGWAAVKYPRSLALFQTEGAITGVRLRNKPYFNNFLAAEMFYSISAKEARYLFSPDHYPVRKRDDRKYVANRIKNFVRDNGYKRLRYYG